MTPVWFLERYPDMHAVAACDDFNLLQDFRYAVMTFPMASFGGTVTGWMSRELLCRGIRA